MECKLHYDIARCCYEGHACCQEESAGLSILQRYREKRHGKESSEPCLSMHGAPFFRAQPFACPSDEEINILADLNLEEAAFFLRRPRHAVVGTGIVLSNKCGGRMSPLESVTGVLMCWLSESFLFAIVTRLVEREDTGLADTRA